MPVFRLFWLNCVHLLSQSSTRYAHADAHPDQPA